MMKALNLSKTQQIQLKEMQTVNKEKRDAILKDSNLIEEQKTKMKAAKEKLKSERQNDPGWKSRKDNIIDSTKQ